MTAKVIIHQSITVNVEREKVGDVVEFGAEEDMIEGIPDEIRAEGVEDVAGVIVGVAVNAIETKVKYDDQQDNLTSHIVPGCLDHSPPPPSP